MKLKGHTFPKATHFVYHVWTIGSSNYQHIFEILHPIHFSQQLSQNSVPNRGTLADEVWGKSWREVRLMIGSYPLPLSLYS